MSAENGIVKIVTGVMLMCGIKLVTSVFDSSNSIEASSSVSNVAQSLSSMMFYITMFFGGGLVLTGLFQLFSIGDSSDKPKEKHVLPPLENKPPDIPSKLLKKENPIVKLKEEEKPVVEFWKKENIKASLIIPPKSIYDMEDETLNTKINKILVQIDKLFLMNTLNTNGENKQLLENTKNKYLPQLVKNYIGLPIELRKKEGSNVISAYALADQQLDIIQDGMNNIETLILEDKHYEMKVMKRFLEAKFETNKEFEIEAH